MYPTYDNFPYALNLKGTFFHSFASSEPQTKTLILTSFILMDFSIHINLFSKESSILYFKGPQVEFTKLLAF